jgi:hypothetical protein
MSNAAPEAERLAAAETPFQQVWRSFRKDRLAVAGLYVLIALVVLALVGKLLTEWWVVFDPTTVRLPDKLRPPFSTPSPELLATQLPTWASIRSVPTSWGATCSRACCKARSSRSR